MKKGFTIIEVLVVVALMIAVAGLAAPVFSGSLASRDVDAYSVQAASALREAQSAVMAGRNNARYGVHFETSRFTLFEGATYDVNDANNIATLLPGTVSITAVGITPAGADVHFASHKGTPTETGAIVFTSNTGEVKNVIINAAGMIDVQ